MPAESVTISYHGTTIRPTFGGQRIEAHYVMTHKKYGRINQYEVTCEIAGLENGEAYLRPVSADWIGDKEAEGITGTNDETLIEDAAMELFEDYKG